MQAHTLILKNQQYLIKHCTQNQFELVAGKYFIHIYIYSTVTAACHQRQNNAGEISFQLGTACRIEILKQNRNIKI
jgi:hypothetical protein